jgi:uncharacterized Rossmann fold enzyme
MKTPPAIHPANQEWLKLRSLLPVEDVAIDPQLLQRIELSDGALSLRSEVGEVIWNSGSTEQTSQNISSIPEIGRLEYLFTFGFDDGQYIREVLKRLPKSSALICIEPSPEFFYKICEVSGYADILSHERFHLIVGLESQLEKIDKVGELVVQFESCKELHRPFPWIPDSLDFSPFRKKLQSSMMNSIKMTHAVKNTTDVSAGYSLGNIPMSLKCGDAEHLRQVIQGKPYIVVGMGPSLSTQIEMLKKIEGKAFIAATDNTIKELLLEGIHPDIVFHVEWRDESKEFYKGIQLKKSSVLCFGHGTNSDVPKMWPSLKVAYPSPHVELIFSEITRTLKWEVNIGATVGDFAIHFGVQCGASEIYLVGIDACCPTGSYCHPNNSSIREIYQEVNRFWSPERWDWGYVTTWPDRLELEGWDGEPVHSIGSFKRTVDVIDLLNKKLDKNQKIFTTSQYGAKYNAELASLEKLEAYPDLDKTLAPSQDCVSEQEVMPLINIKRKQVIDYYRRLKQFSLYLNSYIEAYDKKAKNVAALERNFLGELENFKSHHEKFAWIENLLVVLDHSLAMRSGRDERKKIDTEDDVAVITSAKNFADYVLKISPFEDVLIGHLNNIESSFNHE